MVLSQISSAQIFFHFFYFSDRFRVTSWIHYSFHFVSYTFFFLEQTTVNIEPATQIFIFYCFLDKPGFNFCLHQRFCLCFDLHWQFFSLHSWFFHKFYFRDSSTNFIFVPTFIVKNSFYSLLPWRISFKLMFSSHISFECLPHCRLPFIYCVCHRLFGCTKQTYEIVVLYVMGKEKKAGLGVL